MPLNDTALLLEYMHWDICMQGKETLHLHLQLSDFHITMWSPLLSYAFFTVSPSLYYNLREKMKIQDVSILCHILMISNYLWLFLTLW